MGFIDSLDNVLTNAKGRRQASSGAKAFARSVVPGKPYYSIRTSHGVAGPELYLDVHIFSDKLGLMSATPEGAEGVWLASNGKVYDDRNSGPCRGLPTLSEHTADLHRYSGPNINGNLNDYSTQPQRARR